MSRINFGIYHLSTENIISKYTLLSFFKSIFKKRIDIIEFELEKDINLCLTSDLLFDDIKKQLIEYKNFMTDIV